MHQDLLWSLYGKAVCGRVEGARSEGQGLGSFSEYGVVSELHGVGWFW